MKWGVIVLLVIGMSLTACTTGNVVRDNTNADAKPIVIGQIAALTSFGAEWGNAEKNGVALAVAEANAQGGINGTPIKVAVEDSASDYTQTASAYKKLTAVDGVHVIIGPTWTEFTQVVAPSAKQDGILLMAPSAPIDANIESSPMLFSTYHSLRWSNVPIAEDMTARGFKRIVVVHEQQAFTEGMDQFFTEEAKKRNLVIVDDIAVSSDEKDYRTVILKIKKENPDAVYVLLSFWPKIGDFMKQASDLGLVTQMYSQIDVETPGYMDAYGGFSNGVRYSVPEQSPHHEEFRTKYEQTFSAGPSAPSAETAYDATNLLIAAMRAGAKTPQEISEYLKSIKNYDGASGLITFDEYNQVSFHKYLMKEIRDGKYVFLP